MLLTTMIKVHLTCWPKKEIPQCRSPRKTEFLIRSRSGIISKEALINALVINISMILEQSKGKTPRLVMSRQLVQTPKLSNLSMSHSDNRGELPFSTKVVTR